MRPPTPPPSMNLHELKAAYMLGFYHRAILPGMKLVLDMFVMNESHTEILKAISPLRAAVKRLFMPAEQKEALDKLDAVYKALTELKHAGIDDDQGDVVFSRAVDLCREVEEMALEYADSTLEGRGAALFNAGKILSAWNDVEDPPYKLAPDTLELLANSFTSALMPRLAQRVRELDRVPNHVFWKEHASIWSVHQSVLRSLDMEIARAVFSRGPDRENTSPLTGLPNLVQFDSDFALLLENPDQPVSLAFIDLDDLKALNARIGHDAADEVIQQMGAMLIQGLAHRAVVYHRSGDEFLAVLRNTNSHEALLVLERLVRHVAAQTFTTSAGSVRVSCSVGIATFPEHSSEPEDLRNHANQAMRRAKSAGKSCVYVYSLGDDGDPARQFTPARGFRPTRERLDAITRSRPPPAPRRSMRPPRS